MLTFLLVEFQKNAPQNNPTVSRNIHIKVKKAKNVFFFTAFLTSMRPHPHPTYTTV